MHSRASSKTDDAALPANEKRLTFALGLTASLLFLTYSSWTAIRESTLVSYWISVQDGADSFLLIALFIPFLFGVLGVGFVLYLVTRGLRLCSSALMPTRLDRFSDRVWNGSIFGLTAVLIAGLMLAISFSGMILGFNTTSITRRLAGVVLRSVVAIPVASIFVGWFRRKYGVQTASVYFIVVVSILTWSTYANSFIPLMVLVATSVCSAIWQIERELMLDGWQQVLSLRTKVIIALCLTLSLRVFLITVAPFCHKLDVEFTEYSPHLAELKIRPAGFVSLSDNDHCFSGMRVRLVALADGGVEGRDAKYFPETLCTGSNAQLRQNSWPWEPLELWFDPSGVPNAGCGYRVAVSVHSPFDDVWWTKSVAYVIGEYPKPETDSGHTTSGCASWRR